VRVSIDIVEEYNTTVLGDYRQEEERNEKKIHPVGLGRQHGELYNLTLPPVPQQPHARWDPPTPHGRARQARRRRKGGPAAAVLVSRTGFRRPAPVAARRRGEEERAGGGAGGRPPEPPSAGATRGIWHTKLT